MRLDRVASRIVNANHGIVGTLNFLASRGRGHLTFARIQISTPRAATRLPFLDIAAQIFLNRIGLDLRDRFLLD